MPKTILISLYLLLTCTLMACSGSEQIRSAPPTSYPLKSLTQAEAETILVVGRTLEHEARQYFGLPNGLSKSGQYTYWNYSYNEQNIRTQQVIFVVLTLVFDQHGILFDYDLQSNHYRLQAESTVRP